MILYTLISISGFSSKILTISKFFVSTAKCIASFLKNDLNFIQKLALSKLHETK